MPKLPCTRLAGVQSVVHGSRKQAGRQGSGLCMLCRFFLGSHTSVTDAEVAATVADLLAADRGHTRSLIPKLHKLYCGATDPQQIPPLELLRHPKVHV